MKSPEEPQLVMSNEEFHLLRDVFERASGFVMQENLQFVAERRLAARARTLGLNSFSAYHHYVRFDPHGSAEINEAIDALIPHETYFFREPHQLECFVKEIVPGLLALPRFEPRLSLWSAGCSTGDEAYTLSMLLSELPDVHGFEIDILASDLSSKALLHARKAEYSLASLRSTSPERLASFFELATSGPTGTRYRVKDTFRKRVRFGRINLVDASALSLLPRFDVIFCRNVMIYFDVGTRKVLLDRMYDRLKPGGFLLLGHSEHLLSLSTRFSAVQLENDLVYRRPE
jgi:chemotaxis protein methyltransferase CheR